MTGPGTLDLIVRGIGLLGPGLPSWTDGAARLRDPLTWASAPTVVPTPARLPATERRRAGTVVKASIVVADEACAAAGLDPAQLATVFTSSTGDPLNCHLLCEALATADRLMSPTRFTNSVHNAAAGYWHIATSSRAASTSLAAFDASFAAGLLEAAVQAASTGAPVLLVACDVPYPEPLHAVRPVADNFAVALVIDVPGVSGTPGGIGLRVQHRADSEAPTPCETEALEALRLGIPAARSLPLLSALARHSSEKSAATRVTLESLPGATLTLATG